MWWTRSYCSGFSEAGREESSHCPTFHHPLDTCLPTWARVALERPWVRGTLILQGRRERLPEPYTWRRGMFLV